MKKTIITILLSLLIFGSVLASAIQLNAKQQTNIINYVNARNLTYMGYPIKILKINNFIIDNNQKTYIVFFTDINQKNWTYFTNRAKLQSIISGLP